MFIQALRPAFISALAPPFRLSVLNGLQALFAQNVGAWFRPAQAITTPWYQDSNGVTPVTAVEQLVGFAVDRSIGGVRGPELVTNGTFATDTAGWATSNATLSVVAGRLRITNTAPNGGAIQGEATIIGKTYICSADFSKSAINGVLSVTNNIGGGGSFASVFGVATGPISFMFVATAATTYVVPYINAGVAGDIADFDNISVKLLDGNHVTQPTAASRPVLSARVNLFTKTEQLDDAVWIKQAGITVTPNTTVAPDGTITADTVTSTSTNAIAQLAQFSAVAGVPATAAVYVRANTPTTVTANFNGNANATNNGLGTTAFGVTTSWQRFTHSKAIGAADTGLYLLLSGIAGQDFQVWGAQLEFGVSVPSRYQRVNTATDYDTAGFPSYTKFDGVDDSLSSATGGGGTAGFLFCAAIQLTNVGAVQTLFSDRSGTSGYIFRVNADNTLILYSGNGTVFSTVATAPLVAGVLYLVTGFDDGVKLSVQLGINTPVFIARPPVAAGQNLFSLGKSASGELEYFGGKFYEAVYARNTGLTPAQRLQVQRQVAAAAGIVL